MRHHRSWRREFVVAGDSAHPSHIDESGRRKAVDRCQHGRDGTCCLAHRFAGWGESNASRVAIALGHRFTGGSDIRDVAPVRASERIPFHYCESIGGTIHVRDAVCKSDHHARRVAKRISGVQRDIGDERITESSGVTKHISGSDAIVGAQHIADAGLRDIGHGYAFAGSNRLTVCNPKSARICPAVRRAFAGRRCSLSCDDLTGIRRDTDTDTNTGTAGRTDPLAINHVRVAIDRYWSGTPDADPHSTGTGDPGSVAVTDTGALSEIRRPGH